ncbi:hypothetical protein IV203_003068 [Nitzschia inconspicua]|uniref:Uncharacterized protein n=1 Tax=Nitzschia inconspicua TaxID=303405 RepID=A0A9K3PND4_9STRA|nr:hypothetical protein IV203_003068 [Nitzschia inconspicua]
MSWIVSSRNASKSDRIRPSEINGCAVQQVSYLEEIDDENVLEALQRLRGRSLAVPVGAFVTTKSPGRPPRTPKQLNTQPPVVSPTPPTGSNNSTSNPTISSFSTAAGHMAKGNHRSFDSRKKQKDVPQAVPLTPDSSIVSSTKSSESRSIKVQRNPIPKKLSWTWLGKSFSDLHCGAFPLTDNQDVGVGVNDKEDEGVQRLHRLIPLGVLNRHLIKGCSGEHMPWYDDGEEEEDETYLSTVMTYESGSTNSGSDRTDNAEDKRDFKSTVARIFEVTAKILVEGGFGENDSVTLYGYNDTDLVYGDEDENTSSDETFFTLESSAYDEDTTSLTDAPDDEIFQDLRDSKNLLVREDNRSFAKHGKAMDDNEEGLEINENGLPHLLSIVGDDPPEDCSLLSESSPPLQKANRKKSKVINKLL